MPRCFAAPEPMRKWKKLRKSELRQNRWKKVLIIGGVAISIVIATYAAWVAWQL